MGDDLLRLAGPLLRSDAMDDDGLGVSGCEAFPKIMAVLAVRVGSGLLDKRRSEAVAYKHCLIVVNQAYANYRRTQRGVEFVQNFVAHSSCWVLSERRRGVNSMTYRLHEAVAIMYRTVLRKTVQT